MISSATLKKNHYALSGRIKNAATISQRNPEEIKLVAVTKAFSPDIWQTTTHQNLTIIGESKVQEAQLKKQKFKDKKKIELHLIGHLQTNKAKIAVDIFDIIQTVDSLKLAFCINNVCEKIKRKQSVFLQVNIGSDPNKHGFTTNSIQIAAEEISKMEYIRLDGIMTIPQYGLQEKELKKTYERTRKLRDKIQKNINTNCRFLSMGMSEDFETAIIEGATHIRIGTALFGERPK